MKGEAGYLHSQLLGTFALASSNTPHMNSSNIVSQDVERCLAMAG